MKRLSIVVLTAATAACVIASMPFTAGGADDEGSPIWEDQPDDAPSTPQSAAR
jgi:hypothetical protein